MKQKIHLLFICSFILLAQACSPNVSTINSKEDTESSKEVDKIEADELIEKVNIPEEQTDEKGEIHEVDMREQIDFSLFETDPTEWGENVSGVKTTFKTDEKEMALTFDACGGPSSDGFDEELISFLKAEQVPATLFINERWIEANEDLFLQLADDPLFQIENHGTVHAPLSVNGGEVYGIAATDSAEAVYDEIMTNHATVEKLIDEEMTLFRSGTAYYDEVAVELAEALGYTVVNFDILGDAGATFSSTQVKNALLQAKPGSIALLHMNQPTSGTAAGVQAAVPLLREQGFEFVLLKDKQLQ